MTDARCFLRSAQVLCVGVAAITAGTVMVSTAWAAEGAGRQARSPQEQVMPRDETAAEAAVRQLSPEQRAELREQLRSEWNARHPAEGGQQDPGSARADSSSPRRGWNLPFPWRDPRH
ncbi:hypothetical protein [uncultured Pseudacidovorax sp.]|uniref:hypothetical protein n=1 Tax=uncultured Pseudacidovorax sp. TaxID=679313 RepID=UPI0025ED1E90|nr:hypothetical protein [uncultured Pseudacidovorax sp.]